MSASRQGRVTTDSDLLPLVETIYEAALRPDAWTEFLAILCAAIEAQAGFFQIYNTNDQAGMALWWHGFPDEMMVEIPAWASRDPHLLATTPLLKSGRIVPSPVTRGDLLKTEFYNEFLRHHLPTGSATGACVYGDGTTHVILGVARAIDDVPFDGGESRVLALLMPHLQRAMVVHQRLGHADLQHATNLDTLNRLDFGIVLLSRHGAVLEMNDAARTILADENGLRVTAQGKLATRDGRDQARLETLLAGACNAWQDPLRSGGGAMTIIRPGTTAPLEVLASPLRIRRFAFAPDPAAAVVFVRDPERSSVPAARLQQIYGLTVAEARVAQRLKTGESVSELSDSLKISVATARTHVRRLLDKMGAKSLSDLTRRIAGLPPVR